MADRSLVVSGLAPASGPSLPAHLAALVAADGLVRAGRSDGVETAWAVALAGGGLAGQYAAEEELVREGLDRAHLGRESFAARADAIDRARRDALAPVLAALGVDVDLEEAAAAGRRAGLVARTAFVRLFETGLVREDERVVDVCPRCVTVVGTGDAVADELEGETLVLRMPGADGEIGAGPVEVRCPAPELLPGVVAVAVPPGHPGEGRVVAVPLTATTVAVVADPSVDEPTLVVPAHDGAALDLARRQGWLPVLVVDSSGVVRAPGPLYGLARYAARAAARQLLAAEGAVVAVEAGRERAARCPACTTVLVPKLGRHWFLARADLETAAADAVRDGLVDVAPAAAREELLSRAGDGPEWCVSRQLWVGEPLPVARCLDCGQEAVAVEPSTSCGRCMGHLVRGEAVLDGRFVASVWPLAAAGWPDGGDGPAGCTVVVASCEQADAAAMVGLGLRLTGAAPCGRVVVVAPAAGG